MALLSFAGLAVSAPGAADPDRDPELVARAHLARHSGALGLSRTGVEPGFPSRIDHLGQAILRFPLRLEGLPVFFREVAVQVDAGGTVRRVACRAPLVAAALTHPDPSGADTAGAARAAGLAVSAPEAGWLDGGERLIPVARAATSGPEPMMFYLAAGTARVLHAEPLLDRREPLALIFTENPVTTPSPEFVTLPLLDQTGDRLLGA